VNTLVPAVKEFNLRSNTSLLFNADECNACQTLILSCKTHVDRKIKEEKGLTGEVYMVQEIEPKIDIIYRAKSPHMVKFFCETFISILEKEGKKDFIAYFKNIYYNDIWKNFYQSSTPPGYISDNNLLESFNGAIKKLAQRVKLQTCLTTVMMR
jgi:hypothetical protein